MTGTSAGRLVWSDALWLARRRTPNDRLRTWASIVTAGVAAGLLSLAITLTSLGWDDFQSSVWVVGDGGTRGGVAFAVGLVALAALYLTGRTWQLGSVERRARLSQLRDAGASPDDLRRIVVADTVFPVALGGVVGVLVLAGIVGALNSWPSRVELYREGPNFTGVPTGQYVWAAMHQLLPNPLLATPWSPVLAVFVVCAASAWVAARAARDLVRGEHGHALSPVAAVGRALAARSGSPSLLLALRRIAAEPRTTTRPAGLLALAALVASSAAWLEEVARVVVGAQMWNLDSYHSQAFALVRWWLGAGLLLCGLGLVISLADSVVRRRRADASALASGVPLRVLRRAVVWQTLLLAVPAVVAGTLAGILVSVAFTGLRVDTGALGSPPAPVPFPWVEWALWPWGILAVVTLAAGLASTLLRRTTRVDQLRVPA